MKKIERVREYLRQHRKRKGHDPELIHRVFSDVDAEPAPLFASDLDYLVGYALRGYVVVGITPARIHVYGPFTRHQADKAVREIQDQADRDRLECRIEVRPLIDTERKNMELAEKNKERRRGR